MPELPPITGMLQVLLSGAAGDVGHDRLVRWRKTATTWVAKTVALMRWIEEPGAEEALKEVPEERLRAAKWLVGHEAGRLLQDVLNELDMLAHVLNEEDLEDVRARVRELDRRVRDRILATKMSNTTGRTEEEAAMFRRKAAELAGKPA